MMKELQYCPAEQEDICAIYRQCEVLIRQYEDTAAIDLDKVLAWLKNKIENNIHQYTCVMQNGRKVAYYRLEKDADVFELDDLYVLPEFRGKGIGTQILRRCIDTIDLPIFLYVFKKNIGAVRLYERFGFRITESVGATRMIMQLEKKNNQS